MLEILKKIHHKKNQKFSDYTTMKVGGVVEWMFYPKDIDEMITLLIYIKSQNIPYFILGKGSNLIVNDEGVDVIVINTSNLQNLSLIDETLIYADSGVSLEELSMFALEHSLTGLEFASGIPGTVGGAVFMNAGAYDGEIKDVLETSTVFTDDKIVLNNSEHEFGYRTSSIASKVILGSSFRLKKGDKNEIKSKMIDLNLQRASKQPLEMPSAGSTFKRPVGHFAGKLITDAGLKGFECGGASISTKHAGFVVNHDHAKAQDILDLIAHVQDVVKKEFDVHLEPEIKFLQKDGTFRKFL